MTQSGADRQLATEILQHAESLLDTPLNPEQQERIRRIRQAAMELIPSVGHHADETIPADEPRETTTEKKGGCILLVEDNPFTQKLMTRLLTQQGWQVTLAQNGQEALEQLTQTRFDMILMDLRMPVMDGFAATAAIRQQEESQGKPRMPIIAVTALTGEEERKRAMAVGMDDFHAKPVRATVLFEEMERLLSAAPSTPIPIPAPAETPMIVDMQRLLKTVDHDLELLLEITNLYFTDAPRQMARIQRAIANGEADEIREAAHSLKGATGAFGRVEVFQLAFALEQAGRDKALQNASQLWNQLTDALKIMEETIRKEIQQTVGEAS